MNYAVVELEKLSMSLEFIEINQLKKLFIFLIICFNQLC